MSTASAERTTDRRSTTPMDVGKGSLKDRQEIDKPSFAKTSTLLKAFRYYIIRMISCPVPGLPSFIPIIGGKTAVELIATAAIIVIGTLSSGTSGKAADYLGAVTILLCMRHNILTLVFGISFERAIFWHKVLGVTATIVTGIHGGSHGSNRTGVGILSCMCIAAASYFIKPYWFELFYYVHILCYIAILPMIMKHYSAKYFTYAAAFWVVDLVLRYIITQHCIPMEATVLPGDVIRLKFNNSIKYHPGQYVFLLVPEIHRIEYHPFSFSSAPNDEFTTIHIRVLGDWTHALLEHINKGMAANTSESVKLNVYVEGPYGNHQIDLDSQEYEVLVLISGGIGITPMQSVFNDLVEQVNNGRPLRKVLFLWSVKDRALVDAFHYQQKDYGYLPLSFQPPLGPTPRVKSGRTSPSTMSLLNVEDGSSSASHDIQSITSKFVFFTEYYLTQVRNEKEFDAAGIHPDVQQWLKFGRLNVGATLSSVADLCDAENIKRVGVCVCGPASLVSDVKGLCNKTQLNPFPSTVRFDCHSELFDF